MYSDSIEVFVPKLQELLSDTDGELYEKLGVRKPDPAKGIREAKMMYLADRTFGSAYIDSIVVNGQKSSITFRQWHRSGKRLEESIDTVMTELGIDHYTPSTLSYWMLAPGWQSAEDDDSATV